MMAQKATPAKVIGLLPILSANGAKIKLPVTTAKKYRLPKSPILYFGAHVKS